MERSNGSQTPMDSSVDVAEVSNPALKVLYREAVASLMYLMVGTRPDIAFAASQMSKFAEAPTPLECICVKLILRYIKYSNNL
jgi:hypothetical protein